MVKTLIARKDPNGKTQSIWEHARNVAHISALVSHYPKTSKLIAYIHDLGKLSDDFQDYIINGGRRGSVIHAWQGAFLANELFTDNSITGTLLKELIGFCISSHHNMVIEYNLRNWTLEYEGPVFSDGNNCKYC